MRVTEDDAEAIMGMLDNPCWSCADANGIQRANPSIIEDDKCAICSGQGYLLTAAGEKFLNFLHRHQSTTTKEHEG